MGVTQMIVKKSKKYIERSLKNNKQQLSHIFTLQLDLLNLCDFFFTVLCFPSICNKLCLFV